MKKGKIIRKLYVCAENIKDSVEYIVAGTIVVAILGGMTAYYLPDNFQDKVKQVSEADINPDDLEILENGEMYYIFSEGEHKVKMSHNDMFYRHIEAVEGYEIADVEVNGWRDNSQVTFVNTEPVKVKMTSDKEGKLKFDDFGEVIEEEKVRSK